VSDFVREDLRRLRTATTLDGVAGPRLRFRVDVTPGSWQLGLWLEVEPRGAQPPLVQIQGHQVDPGWQEFHASIDPRESPELTYRVMSAAVEVGDQGLSFELDGRGVDVHLLSVTLIRIFEPTTSLQRQFYSELEVAGGLESEASLASLLNSADESLQRDPADSFTALARQRIELLAEAEKLAAMRGWQWADQQTGTGMFDRMNQTIMLLDGLLGADGARAGPLTDRAQFLRGRLLYWLAKEHGGAVEASRARKDLKDLRSRHQDNDLLAMYTGAKIDVPDPCDSLQPTEGAPVWSNAQREALCRMRQIVRWWVDHQQADTGEFGGKFGDDVELLRWWAPLALSGDQAARRGWQRLADGVWHSKHVVDGYASKARDVEHAAEFVADTAPMMAVLSDDPEYLERLECSARHFERLWTGITPQGRRFFRSAWFSATSIAPEEPKGRDVDYNARAARALRYLAWRRGDPEVIQLLHKWSQAWHWAALRTDKGKPRGILPPSIRFVDEAINGDELTWHRANMEWDYYDWEGSCGALLLDQLLFTYILTGDKALLEPIELYLALIQAVEPELPAADRESLIPGSRPWAVSHLIRSRYFWSVVQQWRLATGDSRWDDLITRHGTDYARYRITGQQQWLLAGLDRCLEGIRYNTPLLTTEAINTDRVYVPGWELVKSMLTGDGMPENASPYFAVTWENTDDGFTALVDDFGPNRLEVNVFSHSSQPAHIVLRPWQLAPGNYRLSCTSPDGSHVDRSLAIAARGERIEVPIPERKLAKIKIEGKHRD